MASIGKNRLEAFSDGVIAIIITIMVLELKIPHGDSIETLAPLVPAFLSYLLSFVYVGIYWNNHHHMLHTATRVTGGVLWANLHLLFWLSLFPFVTGWMGENHFGAKNEAIVPTAYIAGETLPFQSPPIAVFNAESSPSARMIAAWRITQATAAASSTNPCKIS